MANFIASNPLLSITSISFVVTLVTTLIYKYTTDQVKLKQVREDIKRHQEDLKKNQHDPKKVAELRDKLMALSFEPLKLTLKPLLITMVPALVVFAWIRNSVDPSKVILNLPFNFPKIGDNSGFGWLGVYIITSVIFSTILRKVLKVY